MNNFDESMVKLTPQEIEIETSAALDRALQKKISKEKEIAYWKKVNSMREESILTAIDFEKKIQQRSKIVYGTDSEGNSKLKIDEFNSDIFTNMYKYFTNDPTGKYDLNKGLMLQGNVGSGKSKFMELFKFNQKSSYMIKSARIISDEYSEKETGGAQIIKKYSNIIQSTAIDLTYGQKEIGLCIDDIGTENESMHMGTRLDSIQNIILNRYDRLDYLIGKTHFTTNLTPSELEKKYGLRFRSRLNEMFNQVIFPESTPDRRRNN